MSALSEKCRFRIWKLPHRACDRDKIGASGFDPLQPTSQTYLIESDRLVRAVKGEGRNLHIEAITMLALHLIAARHDAGRRRERHTTRVFKRVTGLKTRLFADNAPGREPRVILRARS